MSRADAASGAHRALAVEPLTRATFAPFGQLIDPTGVAPVVVNAGTAQKFPALAEVELVGGGAAAISIFRAQPRPLPMPLLELERHPLGSQAFVPLTPTRFLVVVAGSAAEPQPEQLRLFLATGQQGVNFRAGVWHHALLALDQEVEFLVVERRQSEGNVELLEIAPWKMVIEAT